MKVRTISRSKLKHTRERPQDLQKVHRNNDAKLHGFARAREYKRALNATKLDKVFAKPFVGALEGHADGVYCMASSPTSLVAMVSGAGDGEVKVWDIAYRKNLWSVKAHQGMVNGVTVCHDGRSFFSAGFDKKVHQFSLAIADVDNGATWQQQALQSWVGNAPFTSIDHHHSNDLFATSSEGVDIWDHSRSAPLSKYDWGHDTVTSVKFNPADANILTSCAMDGNITLYDLRANTPTKRLLMAMRSNAVAWNPREPMYFTAANEDHNLYTFDMRTLKKAVNVHKDFLGAVMDVAYSPTGREFVAGSYDRTVRIFRTRDGRSREVYHARRMQRVFTVSFSADAQYVLSGSDDMNVRLWKAQASQQMGQLLPREQKKQAYLNSLKQRFSDTKEIKKISRHRHLPKALHNAKKRRADAIEKVRRKDKNRRKYTKVEDRVDVKEKEASIVKVVD